MVQALGNKPDGQAGAFGQASATSAAEDSVAAATHAALREGEVVVACAVPPCARSPRCGRRLEKRVPPCARSPRCERRLEKRVPPCPGSPRCWRRLERRWAQSTTSPLRLPLAKGSTNLLLLLLSRRSALYMRSCIGALRGPVHGCTSTGVLKVHWLIMY